MSWVHTFTLYLNFPYLFPALYTSFTSASTVLNLSCYESKLQRAQKRGVYRSREIKRG